MWSPWPPIVITTLPYSSLSNLNLGRSQGTYIPGTYLEAISRGIMKHLVSKVVIKLGDHHKRRLQIV
jgi:hypothetical protein